MFSKGFQSSKLFLDTSRSFVFSARILVISMRHFSKNHGPPQSPRGRVQRLKSWFFRDGWDVLIISGGFHSHGVPQARWMVYFMETPNLKQMIWGYPHCRKPPYI